MLNIPDSEMVYHLVIKLKMTASSVWIKKDWILSCS